MSVCCVPSTGNIALPASLGGAFRFPAKGNLLLFGWTFNIIWVIALISLVSCPVTFPRSLVYTSQKNGIRLVKKKCAQTDCGGMKIKCLPTSNIKIKNYFHRSLIIIWTKVSSKHMWNAGVQWKIYYFIQSVFVSFFNIIKNQDVFFDVSSRDKANKIIFKFVI